MLEELFISSVGGVKEARLTFCPGLTVITGESGTGKSSILRALEMVSGRRVTATAVRSGDQLAVAQAVFTTLQDFPFLDQPCQPQDQSMILRREFSQSGRGKCAIQDQTVSLGVLAQTAGELLALQSQFAQLALLDGEEQLRLLDRFGGPELLSCRQKLADALHRVIEAERGLRALTAEEKELQERFSNAERVREVLKTTEAGESPESLELQLNSLESRLRGLQDLKDRRRRLNDGEGGGLQADLAEVLGGIELLSGEDRENLLEAREQVAGGLDRLCRLLDKAASAQAIADLEEETERLESRLGRLRKAFRLSGLSSFDQLSDWLKEADRASQWLAGLSDQRTKLAAGRAEGTKELSDAVACLRQKRRDAAGRLKTAASAHLSGMAMEGCGFDVVLTKLDKVRANGAENVDFVLCRGSGAVSVAKGASGGELSRILLALQLSLPPAALPQTLAFDEVEAGLGGRAAYLTGLKLKELSKDVQVILVTHEAIIASLADAHYGVTRQNDETSVRLLEGESRVAEIARMLAGSRDEKSLAHARHLLETKSVPAIDERDERLYNN